MLWNKMWIMCSWLSIEIYSFILTRLTKQFKKYKNIFYIPTHTQYNPLMSCIVPIKSYPISKLNKYTIYLLAIIICWKQKVENIMYKILIFTKSDLVVIYEYIIKKHNHFKKKNFRKSDNNSNNNKILKFDYIQAFKLQSFPK